MQSKINFDEEEVNQYFYSFEQDEDLTDEDGSLALVLRDMQLKLKERRRAGKSTNGFLTEYEDELGFSLKECIVHHQNIVKICGLLEQFYNPVVLVKSLQVTLQICNLAYVSTTVCMMRNDNHKITPGKKFVVLG